MPGFKQVNGFLWPESDTDCMAVVFDRMADLDVALKHCRAFEVAVQAGGAQGVWPKRLGERFSFVHTFEPEPENFDCLTHNCPEPHIQKRQAALGASHSLIGMTYPEGRRNMGSCCVDGQGEIPMVRLDVLGLSVCDFIQLDVEGYEPEAIKGAMETIRRCRPVVMVEDKGLSVRYGWLKGWSDTLLEAEGYRVVERINRDVVLVHGG